MTEGLLLALGAGVLAAVNPCGFALLPAYLSLLVVDPDQPGRVPAVRRALTSTAAMTLGFVAVFGVFGVVVSPLASGIQSFLPVVTAIIGLSLALAGAWLLAGRSLPKLGWSPSGPRLSRRWTTMVGFGASYAVASLTCTIGPFLAIVVGSLRAGSIGQAVLLFVAYGVGMGLLVGATSLAVALAQTTMINRIRRWGGGASRLTGLVLIVVGGYVGYYGWWEFRVLRGGSVGDPIIDGAARLQAQLATAIERVGLVPLATLFVILIGLGLAVGRAGHQSKARHSGGGPRSERQPSDRMHE